MPKKVESKTQGAAAGACDPTALNIAGAGALLRAGALVAFPTETVYGLGADATNGRAVAEIFRVKGRPQFNPLIVHVPDAQTASLYGVFSNDAMALAEAFWPGPLTVVVPRLGGSAISELVSCGLDTLALRAPDHPVTQELLLAAQRPLAAPSANRSGHVSATRADHVAADLGGRIAMILDGGATRHGVESTVVSLAGDAPVLMRPGAITIGDIEAAIGRQVLLPTDPFAAPQSPGRLESHYAPRAALRLDATHVQHGEAFLSFGPLVFAASEPNINLSKAGDLEEAAANLFAALRVLDATGVAMIAVAPIPESGLGEAINDRLRRAAAPRR